MLLAVLAIGVFSPPLRGHETDQFSVPVGKQFADLSDYISEIGWEAINQGVAKTNVKIKRAVDRNDQEALAELHGPDVIANDVYMSFPNAVLLIEEIEGYVERRATRQQYPGRIVGYQEFSYIYDHNFFPLDPRQVFKIWRSSTIYVNGVYLGTDKVGHFTDMGMNYYKKYRGAIKDGKSEEEAREVVIDFAINDAILGEKGLIGLVSSSVYSNADLASNWAGMKFYINLTQPTLASGEVRPPLLVRDGDFWALAPHVTKDGDWFVAFFTPHFDEVLNPSLHGKSIRDAVRVAIEKRADSVRAWYSDANGMQRLPDYFAKAMEDLRTYYGEDYGWWDEDGEILTVSNTCFKPIDPQLVEGSSAAAQLMQGAYEGNPAMMRFAISDGADANAQLKPECPFSTEAGNRPLHMAARRGAVDAVHLLVDAGADVNAMNVRSVTPLHMAAHEPHAAERLIQSGAKIDVCDVTGRSPLHWASNNPSVRVADLLISQGADVNQPDNNGQTPLHLAAQCGDIDVIKILLSAGSEINARARYDTTPLHIAVAAGEVESVKLLIERGADVNAKDEFGCTPLHDAARLNSLDVVKALLAGQADVNARDANGTTPLHLAARYNRPTIVEALFEAGADGASTNDVGVSPLEEARRKKNTAALAVFHVRSGT